MKQREAMSPAAGKLCLQETPQRLVQLYEAIGQPDLAAAGKMQFAGHATAGK
jgi:hypothetical protein